MANRLTKGNGLFGVVRASAALRSSGRSSEKRAAATEADGASMSITAAEFYTDGIMSATPTAARNIQAPTATDIIALAKGYAVGDTFEFTLINLAAATHALTLTVNTGLTIVGSAAVSAASSGTWLVRIASSSTVVCYRK